MNLPELRRARREWLTRPRLVLGAVAATAVGATAAVYVSPHRAGENLSAVILVLQAAALFLYGVPALVRDFAEEHEKNTWDLLRLTPLDASEIVLGKALAATSYAVFLAALLAPWTLLAQSLDGAPGLAQLGLRWAWLAVTFCATTLTAVTAAAVGSRLQGGKLGSAGMALGGLGFAAFVFGWSDLEPGKSGPALAGMVSAATWLFATGGLWLFWAAVGAKGQVGRLLSQRGPRWALPGFIATVWAYCLAMRPVFAPRGDSPAIAATCLAVPALVALLSSLAEGERPASWAALPRRLPPWAAGWGAVAAVSLLTALVSPGDRRLALIIPFFLARDLLILSYARLVAARSAEAWAMGALGVLYLVPGCFLLGASSPAGLHWLLPTHVAEVSFLANALPALLHAGAAGLLLWAGLRERRKDYALPAPAREPAA